MRERLKRQSFNHRNKKSFSGSFRAPKKENKFKIFIIIALSSIAIILLLLFYFIFISGFFNIRDIKIENANGKTEKLQAIVEGQIDGGGGLFSQKNIIIFNKNKLSKSLAEFNFANFSLKKNIWQRHLILKVSEREEALIYLESDVYYFLDKSANVVKMQKSCDQTKVKEVINASSTASSTASTTNEVLVETSIDDTDCLKLDDKFKQENFLPFIENISPSKKISENQKYAKLDEEYLSFAFKLYTDLNNSSEFGFKKIVLDEEYNTIKVKLNNNLDIYLSLKNDYQEQISKFFTVSRERASELSGKKYIDLRYGDKIFYY